MVRTGGSCVILEGCYFKDNSKKRHGIVAGCQETDISGLFYSNVRKVQEREKDELKNAISCCSEFFVPTFCIALF